MNHLNEGQGVMKIPLWEAGPQTHGWTWKKNSCFEVDQNVVMFQMFDSNWKTLVYFKGAKIQVVLNWCLVVIILSVSCLSLIKWGTLSSSVLSFCLSLSLSVLCFVAKARSPAACCTYFWGVWSLERRSHTNASLRWRETPERCGQWEGPWRGTRWVRLTLIDRFLSYLLCLVK